MFPVKLGNLLSVELQQLPGWTQVRQTLVDGGQWGVRFPTWCPIVGSVGKKKLLESNIKVATFHMNTKYCPYVCLSH